MQDNILTILIPSITEREQQLDALISRLEGQIEDRPVLVRYLVDNKEMSIGMKRQYLLNHCNTEWFVMVDDDDNIADDYVEKVLDALSENPDCVGYLESVNIGGKATIAAHSNRFSGWGDNKNGYDHVRTIYYKDVIRTSIAKKVGFKDLRYGEDHDFSIRLRDSGLLLKEVFINEIMYFYSAPLLSDKEFKKRYGIKA